jgi:hypothetical protein
MRETRLRQRWTPRTGILMRSALARRLAVHPPGIDPALWRFTDECNGFFSRLIGYMGALSLTAIVLVSLWEGLQPQDPGPALKPGWSLAARAYPAFAVSQSDLVGKTEAYEIFQHPEGGRRDVLRWTLGDKQVAELEIYRPGREAGRSGPPVADIAARIDPGGARELQAAGLIASKFGPVALLGLIDRGDTPACLGFIKQFETPELRISGWSCHGDSGPARRAAVGCMLNRLILLAAGNDAKLAELFAHAELKRSDCAAGAASPARPSDWVTAAQNPQLRGGL